MLNLNDKVSIITGASSGIGRETAILFSTLGSKLVLSGRNEQNLDLTIERCNQENRSNIIKVVGDLTDKQVRQQIVEKAIEKFGRIDILVNNAGVVKLDRSSHINEEYFDLILNTNLKAVIFLTELCLPQLIQQKGVIVNVSSAATILNNYELCSYSILKAALDKYTKCLAVELAEKGVRVNTINPSTIETEIFEASGMTKEQVEKYLISTAKLHALNRNGKPDEIAKAIAFLASDYSSFITSQELVVDGGRIGAGGL